MAKKSPKKPCKCKEKHENQLYRGFLNYQSSNKMTPGQMNCWKNFIAGLAEEGVLLYMNMQEGTPPCIPRPGHPCPPKEGEGD